MTVSQLLTILEMADHERLTMTVSQLLTILKTVDHDYISTLNHPQNGWPWPYLNS